MAWRFGSRARSVFPFAATEFRTAGGRRPSSSALGDPLQLRVSGSFTGLGSSLCQDEGKTQKRFRDDRADTVSRVKSRELSTARCNEWKTSDVENGSESGDDDEELFDDIRQRFLSFKKDKFLKEAEYYQTLAKIQSPKFIVIACADSRVCPSNILGFEPGEAFMIRNVANLVPHSEFGPSETSAALEFAVKSLEVKNILVMGHSSCAGIEALMSMSDTEPSSHTAKWIINGKAAKLRTKTDAARLDLHQQCKHCEKESINESLKNLLTYPWIEERVRKGELTPYGGYYDLTNCAFEKWNLCLDGQSPGEGHGLPIRNHSSWS